MLPALIAWCAQDFLQVLCSGWSLSPDVFFLTVFTLGLCDERRTQACLWGGLLGGVFWDLRWTGVPGLQGALFSAVFLASEMLWWSVPKEGRLPSLFLLFSSAALVVVFLPRFFLSEFGRSLSLTSLGWFILLSMPSLLGAWLYYGVIYRRQNV